MIPELLAQNAVLLAKVINDMQLPLVHPARHGQQNETERIEHFGHNVSSLARLTHANELEGIQTVPISRPYGLRTSWLDINQRKNNASIPLILQQNLAGQ